MCFYEYDVYDCIVCKEVMHTKPYLLLREPGATQFETIDKRCPTAQRLDMLAENCPFVKYNNFPRRIRLQPNQFCSKVCEGSYRRAHQKAKRREEAAGGQGGSWKTASHLDSGSDFNKYRRSPAHKRGRSPSPHSRWMYDGWEGKQEEGLVSLQDDGYSNYYYDPGESSCSSSTVPTKHRPQPSPPLEDFREVYEKAYGCVSEGSVGTACSRHRSPSPLSSGDGNVWVGSGSCSEIRGRSRTVRPVNMPPSRHSGEQPGQGRRDHPSETGGHIQTPPSVQTPPARCSREGKEVHGENNWPRAGGSVQSVRPAQRSPSRRSWAELSGQNHRCSPVANVRTVHTAPEPLERYEW